MKHEKFSYYEFPAAPLSIEVYLADHVLPKVADYLGKRNSLARSVSIIGESAHPDKPVAVMIGYEDSEHPNPVEFHVKPLVVHASFMLDEAMEAEAEAIGGVICHDIVDSGGSLFAVFMAAKA